MDNGTRTRLEVGKRSEGMVVVISSSFPFSSFFSLPLSFLPLPFPPFPICMPSLSQGYPGDRWASQSGRRLANKRFLAHSQLKITFPVIVLLHKYSYIHVCIVSVLALPHTGMVFGDGVREGDPQCLFYKSDTGCYSEKKWRYGLEPSKGVYTSSPEHRTDISNILLI